MSDQPLRVAIVGSGPAGIYAADALTRQQDVPVSVDVLDRLPTPFGLVRYGVAPDHLSIRGVRETLWRLLRHHDVRFLGNVELGSTITVDELRQHVDAVIYTFGAARDRRLNIAGEDLPGSLAATDFVAWYCGHPDVEAEQIEAALKVASAAVVVGVGNVAVDVARVLARRAGLDHTDMPGHVLAALAGSPVRSIDVLGRRGPAQAAFTTKELRELGKIDGADVVVDPRDVPAEPDPASAAVLADNRIAARNFDVLRGWAEEPTVGAGDDRVTLTLRFFARPVEIVGEDRVTGVIVERTALDPDGRVVGTGERTLIPADLVVRSVGYQGVGLPDLPFDTRSGVIPHADGRVLREEGPAHGEYVAGWIKRGPTGVIGTNKSDAAETVATLLADVAAGELTPGTASAPDLVEVLGERGLRVFTIEDWKAIDAAEIALGEASGRARTTLHDREALLAAVTAAASHVSQP